MVKNILTSCCCGEPGDSSISCDWTPRIEWWIGGSSSWLGEFARIPRIVNQKTCSPTNPSLTDIQWQSKISGYTDIIFFINQTPFSLLHSQNTVDGSEIRRSTPQLRMVDLVVYPTIYMVWAPSKRSVVSPEFFLRAGKVVGFSPQLEAHQAWWDSLESGLFADKNHMSIGSMLWFGCCPLPVTVTTRIITFLVGNPYKPSFATVTGRGDNPRYISKSWRVYHRYLEIL